MPEVELLDKTEIWVHGVQLEGADLRALAAAAAEALGLEPVAVFVTDARNDHVALDVLRPRVELGSILGRQAELLTCLDAVEGVTVLPGASVHSAGVLGLIGAPHADVEQTLARATDTDARLRELVSRRVAVVSTGPEVVGGHIRDTNVDVIAAGLGDHGFEVVSTGALLDDEAAVVGRVLRLVTEGFGVVITTGGVGAESKDHTIEALQRCDPALATAVLATYRVGHGRHAKPHVRVGVGKVEWTRLIALPGPTREVEAALPVVREGLESGWAEQRFADELAARLRNCLRNP